MIALVFSILCSSYLVLCFKFFQRHGIQNHQAIVFNYITCVITGIIFTREIPVVQEIIHRPWFPYAVFLGLCFYCIFNVMAYVTTTVGVAVTSVASKLSMVIPVTVALLLYHQHLTFLKLIGLLLAIVAVLMTSLKHKKSGHGMQLQALLFAFIIFIGSGINDSVMNYASENFLQPGEFDAFSISVFAVASLSGILMLTYRAVFQPEKLPAKAIVAGVILGIPNYFSVIFLLQALSIPDWESSVIFPINNMGIVVFSTVMAVLLFREVLSKMNIAGIVIGLISICCMILAG